MAGFLSAHGYDPGPTQRPLLAGALTGLLATLPAIMILLAFGSLAVEADILNLTPVATLLAGEAVMAAAGAAYARLFGRAANDQSGGWLFGMAFGFLLWSAGAVMILPLLGGGKAPAGMAAIGVFLSLVAWGGALGLLFPFVHRPLHQSIEHGAKRRESGPAAAAGGGGTRPRR
jgi:hypothetical protein